MPIQKHYSEPQTYKMEFLQKQWTTFRFWLFYKKLHLRCFIGSWIYLYIKYFRKTIAYLFTYIKQYSIVHSQIHMALSLVFLNHVFLKTMFEW